MNEERDSITAKQLTAFTVSAQVGLGLLMLPTEVVNKVGHDAWISIALGSFIAVFIIAVIMLLLKRYGYKSLYDINNVLYGKYLGTFFNLLILLYLSFATVLGLRILTDIITITVLSLTPPLVLAIFMFIPGMYLCWLGLKTICNFYNLIFIILGSVIIYFLLIIPEMKINFILPIGENGISPITEGTIITVTLYLGIELVPLIYDDVTDKEKGFKYFIAGQLVTTIFSIIVVAVSTMVYSEYMLKKLNIALFHVFHVYQSQFFERVDLFFNALWFPAMGASMLAYYFTAFYSIKKIFRINKVKLVFFLYSAAVIVLSRIFKDHSNVLSNLTLLGFLGMIFFAFFIMCYVLSFIHKRGVVKK
jgi:spore germination protein (amino acid permease)